MANKNYIVGDQGYLRKAGQVYQTGEIIALTPSEYENVKDKVVPTDSEVADEFKAIQEPEQEPDKEPEPEEEKKTKTKK